MSSIQQVQDVARILSAAQYVLLDFDGPVCSIFHGVGAPTVAAELRNLLSELVSVPPELADLDDPLEILRYAAQHGPDTTTRIESALRQAEAAAALSARPTPGATELISACRRTRRTVAIVSNNSQAGVEAYLSSHGVEGIDLVVGRDGPDPNLMKPNPHLLHKAMSLLGTDPADCVLVGDSTSDIESARGAGITIVGYANKEGKTDQLLDAGADAIVTTMTDLTAAVLASLPRPIPS